MPEIFRVVGYDDTNPEQPPEIVTVPDQWYPIIGRIIVGWATMEQEASVFASALRKAVQSHAAGWDKIKDFGRRWQVLLDDFSTFAAGDKDLMVEIGRIDRLVKSVKPIRDGLAHRRMLMVLDEGGVHLRFEVAQKNNPWSKCYSLSDLESASRAISEAAGRIFRFMTPDHPTAANLPRKDLLRQLVNMDQERFPRRPKPSHPRNR